MIITTEKYVLVPAEDNRYWAGFFPEWGALATFIACVNGPSVIEPHYHDNDEFWLWIAGEGKARLDHGPETAFSPGTVVYCPMGAVHEFVSPTVQHNIGVTTHLVGQKRATHLHVAEDGEPERTGDGFIVAGADNVGPLQQGRSRCPLTELRLVEGAPERRLAQGLARANEYWLAIAGQAILHLPARSMRLAPGDLAILRQGVERSLAMVETGLLALGRE
jgi:mannose-6-phosphate isomerase-like protein (cupin superfamily)